MTEHDPRGSMWHRWDPHIHTPGTLFEDQFGNPPPWDEYLNAIENSSPVIEALGVTDYFVLDSYEAVVLHKEAGRIPEVKLLFPNVELRLSVGTGTATPVNIHLLVCPDDADHVERAREFLRGLEFEVRETRFTCDNASLIRLGHLLSGNPELEPIAALRLGADQFKVNPMQLRDLHRKDSWARENILIAVAGSSNDGTAGLQQGSLATLRSELEGMSQIIFASSERQRLFWLGEGVLNVEEIQKKYGGPKACLHGSDAHTLAKVGKPDQDRFSWVKGDLTFEALRQACIEPGTRVLVANGPPAGALEHLVVDTVDVLDSDWWMPGEIPLNPGLVGIIGARGSGKTALADLIAAAAGSPVVALNQQSFLNRAKSLLGPSQVELVWGDSEVDEVALWPLDSGPETPIKVQYLSQQFVERLCSAEGMTDELLLEVQRVIYASHPLESRLGTSNFAELLNIRARDSRLAIASARSAIEGSSETIDAERQAQAQLDPLRVDRVARQATLANDKVAQGAIIVQGGEENAARLALISDAIRDRQLAIEAEERHGQALASLTAAVQDLRTTQLPARIMALQRENIAATLSSEDWAAFELRFAGDVDGILAVRRESSRTRLAALRGALAPAGVTAESTSPTFLTGKGLNQEAFGLLKLEAQRLQSLIGLNAANRQRLVALSQKIAQTELDLANLDARILYLEGANERIAKLRAERARQYEMVFAGVIDEYIQLESMYEPLREMLSDEVGALGKLAFTVRRNVDVVSWAARGEGLLDLRKAGAFRGQGSLLGAARNELLAAWTHGTGQEASAALAAFVTTHNKDLLAHAPMDPADRIAYWGWTNQISEWLFGTDHISTTYEVEYDGVALEQLSPGTRGIVLLLLYLSIDRSDDRPLIIDQPEENLDPKSIFVELVDRFRSARNRRQVIIVTHNANLIVNTDVDQVIVAKVGDHRPGQLPELTYESGSLENEAIRAQVCEILEGGEEAFKQRAKRLRVDLHS